jgi:mono/diheme cytochrome c family protein
MQQHHSDILPAYTEAPRPPKIGKPPFWMIALALIFVVGSWLPLVLFARGKSAQSREPRFQLVQDMGMQPKFREQQTSDIFADERADRPVILGTVARGELHEDSDYYLGYTMGVDDKGKPAPKFLDGFPKEVKVDAALLKRGQERFNIYCSACHGLDGQGHGTVNERAMELMGLDTPKAKWTQAANLTIDPVKSRPNGHIYNTINVGIRSMPPYGPQVAPADRWAIVAYIRALQLSYDAPSRILPDDIKEKAKAATKK